MTPPPPRRPPPPPRGAGYFPWLPPGHRIPDLPDQFTPSDYKTVLPRELRGRGWARDSPYAALHSLLYPFFEAGQLGGKRPIPLRLPLIRQDLLLRPEERSTWQDYFNAQKHGPA